VTYVSDIKPIAMQQKALNCFLTFISFEKSKF